jgi:hypothetical protein
MPRCRRPVLPTTTFSETETVETPPPTPPVTSSGATDTGEDPPPDDDGLWGVLALILAAVLGQSDEPATTTDGPTTTEEASTTDEAPTTDAEATTVETGGPGSEPDDGTPWGWIALGLGLVAAAVVGFVAWRRRRAPSDGPRPPGEASP